MRSVIAAVVLLMLAPVGARADDFGLEFRDGRTLKLDWKQAQEGRTVEFCNVGRIAATKLDARALGFGFTSDTKALNDDAVASATLSTQGPVAPGACLGVKLRFTVTGSLDPGVYTGVLSITSAGAGQAQLPVEVTGPEQSPKPAAAVGALDSTEMTADRRGPGTAAKLNEPKLPLKPAAAGEQLQAPRDCPADGGGTKGCPFLGNLYNGVARAEVWVDGPLEEPANGATAPAELPLRVTGATEIGDYSGSLDLAGTPDDTKDDIKLKVTVTDPVGLAIIALLLGTLLALLVQYVLKRLVPVHRLREDWRSFKDDYKAAQNKFNGYTPELEGFTAPSDEARRPYERAIDDGIKTYKKRVVWVDESSEAFKQIKASLDQVRDDIECWADKDGLHRSLNKLKQSAERLAKFLNEELPLNRAPVIAAGAASALKGRQLKVGEALTTASEADRYGQLIELWLESAGYAKRYAAWIEQLNLVVVDDGDTKQLELATVKLGEAINELLDAEDAADLKRLRTTRDLRTVYDLLAPLGVRLNKWLPDRDARPTDLEAVFGSLALPSSEIRPTGLIPRGEHRVSDWIADVARDAWNATPVVIGRVMVPVLAVVGVIFSIVVGIATGVLTFYTGEPWGTTEDYLSVILVGAAATILAQTIVDAIQKQLPPLPDQIVAKPAAATARTEAVALTAKVH